MVTMTAPMCQSCRHFDRDADVPRCAAFTTRIPRYIYDRQLRLHILPLKGDHGIQFEMISDAEQVEAFGQVLPLMEKHQQTLDRLRGGDDLVLAERPASRSSGPEPTTRARRT